MNEALVDVSLGPLLTGRRTGVQRKGHQARLSRTARFLDDAYQCEKGSVTCSSTGDRARIGEGQDFLGVPSMRKGIVLLVNDEELRAWRPRFGARLSSRSISVEGGDLAWRAGNPTLRTMRVTDARSGAAVCQARGESISMAASLPRPHACLALLIVMEGIPLTSSLLWRLVQAV